MSVCWICGQREKTRFGQKRQMQAHVVDGNDVTVHRSCADKEGWNRAKPKNGRLPQRDRAFNPPENNQSWSNRS